MISLLLAGYITTHNVYTAPALNKGQVRRRAHQIVQLLRRQDPKVLRSVMYYMDWVPKMKYTRQKCKKNNNIKTTEDPVMDMLLNEAGIKRKRR